MITGAEMLLIQGGVNALGTVMQMGAITGADKVNSIIAETNARLAKKDAEYDAARIRAQGAQAEGSARSAMAASGVDVAGGGTADLIQTEIAKNTERDAFAMLLSGERAASEYRQSAHNARRDAKDATTSGILQIGATAMDTAAGIDRWKRGIS